MQRLATLVLLSVALGAPASALAESPAVATGSRGAAATVDPNATRVAIQVLRRGGNAVDAAIAANATLGVTEPYVAGIGGGGFMTIYLARTHKVVTIDGRETAPQSFPQDAFIDPATGKPIPFTPQRVTSGMAVGVPGTLATWAKAGRYGTWSLAKLLAPAIAVARKGFSVDQNFVAQTEQNLQRLDAFTSSRSYYLGHDRQAPAIGSLLKDPDLAKAYTLIAREGPKALYDGPIGEAIVQTVQHPPLAEDANLGFDVRPGLMTADDIRAYQAVQRVPTHVNYRGLDVYGMGPPSSGGTTVGESLNILSGFDMSTPDRALALHRYLEATRLAYADRNRWVGDPDKFQVPVDGLLSPEFAAERRCLIGPRAAKSPVAPGNPFAPFGAGCSGDAAGSASSGDEGLSTNHLTVVDSQGNIVSYTTTIEQTAGSAIAVPGYGFLLNNELTDFDPAAPSAGTPDPNLPAGGKRPRSSIAPTIVLKNGKPDFALGSPGGATIITTVLQSLINHVDFGMSLPQAIAAPRASQQNSAQTQAEPAFISQFGGDLTRRFGQDIVVPPPPAPNTEIGAATGIQFLSGGRLQAAAEPVRRGGGVAATVCPAGVHVGSWITIGRHGHVHPC